MAIEDLCLEPNPQAAIADPKSYGLRAGADGLFVGEILPAWPPKTHVGGQEKEDCRTSRWSVRNDSCLMVAPFQIAAGLSLTQGFGVGLGLGSGRRQRIDLDRRG